MVRGFQGELITSATSDSATSCQALCWALCGEGRQQQQGWESPICSPWLSRA